jgi:hypothetical protein
LARPASQRDPSIGQKHDTGLNHRLTIWLCALVKVILPFYLFVIFQGNLASPVSFHFSPAPTGAAFPKFSKRMRRTSSIVSGLPWHERPLRTMNSDSAYRLLKKSLKVSLKVFFGGQPYFQVAVRTLFIAL